MLLVGCNVDICTCNCKHIFLFKVMCDTSIHPCSLDLCELMWMDVYVCVIHVSHQSNKKLSV